MEPVLVVISCSSSPADLALRDGLEKQLHSLVRQQVIRLWHAGRVRAGEVTCEVTLQKLRAAHIILPLISPDYLASEEHEHELKTALARCSEARVMPVVVRSCTLHGTPVAPMKMLPEGGVPVSRWTLADDAWASVARAVRTAAEEIRAGKHHYVPVDILRTAPMGPAAPWSEPRPSPLPAPSDRTSRPTPASPLSAHRDSAAPRDSAAHWNSAAHRNSAAPESGSRGGASGPGGPAVSSPRPSFGPERAAVSAPTITIPGAPVQDGPAGVPPAPAARAARAGGGGARTLGWLLAGAVLATAAWNWRSCLAGSPSTAAPSAPTGRSEAPAPMPGVPAVKKHGVCCGGVSCPESERNWTGSWCERNPTYCKKCPSGRARVDGACADMLPRAKEYLVRVGQALVAEENAPADARVCLRRSGTPDPPTCSTLNEARAGKAPSHPFRISVDALTAGPGVDFWIEHGGRVVASETGALVRGGGIKTGGLCVGVVLHGTRSAGDSVTVFLDDP